MKGAVINVQSNDNACFAWSVVAALHPDESYVYRVFSYSHYTTVLNLQDIEFPVTVNQIKKFELARMLQDTCLQQRKSFYSSLTSDTISESDYAHDENVWKLFSIRTLGEYSDLYLKIDVLLLADIFENFRESCIKSYSLDTPYYYTLPGYTWHAMLKHTNITFKLLTDIDMVMFIERGIRGGLSQCSNRYAHANNKYMESYDPSKPSSYLTYFDVNNLYGWAMCQPLPYADFRWVDDVSDFDTSSIALDSPIGYILEVDLEYPQRVHDAHTDLPFCPTRDKPPSKRQDSCSQPYMIRSVTYIELNTQFRTLAKNDFEKKLYKLMNNTVFGKTMENVRNHVNIKLVTHWDGRYGAEAMIAKPNFHSRSVFSENLIAVKLRNFEVKPIYVGICILDISKTCLYEFHHDYMVPMYREKSQRRFDTSNYAVDNLYGIPLANKKIPGLMKDENNGAIMTEFVGLRAKMYALRVDGKKDSKKVKGVKSNVVARTITFDDYTRCLNEEIEMTRQQSCIRSKLHEVYTICETKIAVSPYDDKRYIVPETTDTVPWGHYKIPL
ncbi:uncharacterized protein LOC115242803 [Formica exsecta]|uniref:uncharacterized protein LOC115242803 n=1 Tax=Formica exsecta TaxID=72781 RepID=UPI0011435408|nr:uncharacterized protein LOC115242803 [Formica exsecta]